jgi:hypothetical protein
MTDLLTKLASQVRNMRQLQKAYFKTRDYSILSQAREAEKAVDLTLAELDKKASPTAPQNSLFS